MRIIDVLATVANNGTTSFMRLYRTKSERTPVPIDTILQKPSAYRFVFQNPLDLHKLLEDPDPASVAICQGMKMLRLDLLQHFTDDKLTFMEAATEDSKSVDLRALMENWRNACRNIPRQHGLEELTFDVSSANELCKLHIIRRTIQIISTTLVLKAAQNLRCGIQGAGSLNHMQMRHMQKSLVSR
ncbi:hypothetical protein ABOM_004055 [Aspergillus bombycis]|uniref:Uncharacterized protein n=1 Tax=Aspergillus bombycis TaxID=109264 RepID=A0A1F8ACY4_9EURO|nr:hypothetical protein ABOM_004055 [Aspergillus bombycis]OGM49215.1 hypothetical protein ABOM_004055 [Aspergillus bombycis]